MEYFFFKKNLYLNINSILKNIFIKIITSYYQTRANSLFTSFYVEYGEY